MTPIFIPMDMSCGNITVEDLHSLAFWLVGFGIFYFIQLATVWMGILLMEGE